MGKKLEEKGGQGYQDKQKKQEYHENQEIEEIEDYTPVQQAKFIKKNHNDKGY